ncbi:hypothetical protein FDP41_004330 [Naegleria fowleri]|uniref:Uncharacterized protein n=1 Tax=Naegleria fowleri TaxID=5763 RepID=A0A6A5BQC9_NAEFO|nr:uncharacterized protein FDP41_004330 [Naegleria fowleri]KAF0976431.1 hypothetical protein FDP41_004330 [Naegleria fowleri]CAG4719351.1 unnamed protein product [Naegleria fowleri]
MPKVPTNVRKHHIIQCNNIHPTHHKIIFEPKLLNAQQLAKEHPRTFSAPSVADLMKVKSGSMVKVCDGQERFWVEVLKKGSLKYLVGRIDNGLVGGQEYSYGDWILFKRENIYEIYEEEEEEDGGEKGGIHDDDDENDDDDDEWVDDDDKQ